MPLHHTKKKSLALKYEEQIKADIAAAEAELANEGITTEEIAEVIEFVSSEAFETYKASLPAKGSDKDGSAAEAPKKVEKEAENKMLIFEKWEVRTIFKRKKDGSKVTDDEGNFIIEDIEQIKKLRDKVKITQEQANTLNIRSHDRNVRYYLKDK